MNFNLTSNFKRKKYQVIRGFLNKIDVDVEFLQDYFYLKLLSSDDRKFGDASVPNSICFYSDYAMETILKRSAPFFGKIVNKKLLPTYSYTRMYFKGAELEKHLDRPSCEISATLTISFSKDFGINPIYFSSNEDESDATPLYLNPGDACLYSGCDMWHWRPPIENEWYLQSFLHFVDADGPFKDFIYDKRPNLGYKK
jgi:hypothetical protein